MPITPRMKVAEVRTFTTGLAAVLRRVVVRGVAERGVVLREVPPVGLSPSFPGAASRL